MSTALDSLSGSPDYVLIVGLGRSGTNWLLDLFDLSPVTFCRNEPVVIDGSSFHALGPTQQVARRGEIDPEVWDLAVAQACVRMGERDHPNHGQKNYFSPISRKLCLHRLVQNPRPRGVLARVMPSLKSGEWLMPRWLGSRNKLAAAKPFLKILRSPAWIAWVLSCRPRVQVLHIVRHPGGFLNSYQRRYLNNQDGERVVAESRDRLLEIADADARWANRFGDIRRMDAAELELWYWLYHTETIHAVGVRSDHYALVVYEELSRNPVDKIMPLYESCGLRWEEPTVSGAKDLLRNSQAIADKWRTQMCDPDKEKVAQILSQSNLVQFWGEAEVPV